jgi:hypothetical protein
MPRRHLISYTTQPQKQTNWCWAAITVNLNAHYARGLSTSQCVIVNGELRSATDCCKPNTSTICNVTWGLEKALATSSTFNGYITKSESLTNCDAALGCNQPLGIRIQWAGGGGHFVAIVGCDTLTGQLTLEDPARGTVISPHSVVATAYSGHGSWTHSYFTR